MHEMHIKMIKLSFMASPINNIVHISLFIGLALTVSFHVVV